MEVADRDRWLFRIYTDCTATFGSLLTSACAAGYEPGFLQAPHLIFVLAWTSAARRWKKDARPIVIDEII
jgi:hypothetical protein